MYIFWNDLIEVMGFVHFEWGETLIKGKLISFTISHGKAMQFILYFINLELNHMFIISITLLQKSYLEL